MSFEQSELDGKYSPNVCVSRLHALWSAGLCCCMRYYMLLYACSLCGAMCFGWAWVISIRQNLACQCIFKCCGGNSSHSRQTWQVQQSCIHGLWKKVQCMLIDN